MIMRIDRASAEHQNHVRCGCGESNINMNPRQCGRPTPKALIAAASRALSVGWRLTSHPTKDLTALCQQVVLLISPSNSKATSVLASHLAHRGMDHINLAR